MKCEKAQTSQPRCTSQRIKDTSSQPQSFDASMLTKLLCTCLAQPTKSRDPGLSSHPSSGRPGRCETESIEMRICIPGTLLWAGYTLLFDIFHWRAVLARSPKPLTPTALENDISMSELKCKASKMQTLMDRYHDRLMGSDGHNASIGS